MTGTSFWHRADVRSKTLAFVAVVACVFLLSDPLAQSLLALGTLGALLWAGARPGEVGRIVGPLLPILACIFLFAALAPPPGLDDTLAFHALPGGHLPVTRGGLVHGTNLALRVVTMLGASVLLLRTTPVEQFTTWLQRLRCPNALVFVIVTAIRFAPTLGARSRQILDAQRARGLRVDDGGLIRRIRAQATIMVPLFASSLRTSDDLATAMLSRGYGVVGHPTILRDLTWGWRDWLLLVGAIALVAGALAWR